MTRLTINEAILAALGEEMRRDPDVYVLGQGIVGMEGVFKAYAGMAKEFGARMIATSISETAMVGVSCGAAMKGMRPVVDLLFSEYLPQALNSLAQDGGSAYYYSAGKTTVPIVLRMRFGISMYRAHPADHYSWLLNTPGVKVVMPTTPYDAKGLMTAAIRDNNPVAFMEHMALTHDQRGEVPDGDFTVPIGKAEVRRPGKDATVLACGRMVQDALDVAATLESEGVEAEVIDLRSLAPLDNDTILESVVNTGRLVIAQENWKIGGSGGEIAAMVAEEAFSALRAPIVRIGFPHIPIPHALPLEDELRPGAKHIEAGLRRLLAA